MSQMFAGPTRPFKPSAAIAQWARVVEASDGTISTAGATDQSIGVATLAVFTTGLNPLPELAVLLNSAQGTRKMIASGTIAKGATVYGAAGGKVSATANGNVEGVCFDGTADGDICEVMYGSDDSGETGVIVGLANGQKMARGQLVTATASDTLVTGLATVVSIVANLESTPVIGCDRATAAVGDQAGAPAAGSALIQTWCPTSNADPTPKAAITFVKKVNWIAIGTSSRGPFTESILDRVHAGGKQETTEPYQGPLEL